VSEETKEYENCIVDWAVNEKTATVYPVTNLDVARKAAQLEQYDPIRHSDSPMGTEVLATQGTKEWDHASCNGFEPWRQGRDKRGIEWILRKNLQRVLSMSIETDFGWAGQDEDRPPWGP